MSLIWYLHSNTNSSLFTQLQGDIVSKIFFSYFLPMVFYNGRQVFCATITDFNGVSVKSLVGLIAFRKWRSIRLRKCSPFCQTKYTTKWYLSSVALWCSFCMAKLLQFSWIIATIFQNLFVIQFGRIEKVSLFDKFVEIISLIDIGNFLLTWSR